MGAVPGKPGWKYQPVDPKGLDGVVREKVIEFTGAREDHFFGHGKASLKAR